MRCLVAIFALVLQSVEVRANDPDADVRSVIDRGLTFLAKDNLAWKESKKCYECHHAPFTIWSLNEAKGNVATKFEPITHASSAWAVMGLVRSAPAQVKPVEPSKYESEQQQP